MRRPHRIVILACLAAASGVLTTGCGSDDSPAPAASGPTALGPAPAGTPGSPGARRVTCDLSTDDGPLTFSFVLPAGFSEGRVYGDESDCSWTMPAPRGEPGPADPSTVSVSAVDDPDQLRTRHDDLAPDEDVGGDDSISDLELAEDVPVFGETVGDTLSWSCFCDGLPDVTYQALAGGVLLVMESTPSIEEQTRAGFETALAGAGTAG